MIEEVASNKRISWLSIVSICASMFFFSAPLGIILGFIARQEIKNNPKSLTGIRISNWSIGLGFSCIAYAAICYAHYVTVEIPNWKNKMTVTCAVAERIISEGGGYREMRGAGIDPAELEKPNISFNPIRRW